MDESQMKEMFMRAQEPQYYERMMLIEDRKLADIIKLGVKIEEGIKNGTVTDLNALKASNKTSQFGESKVAKEVNVVLTTHEPKPPSYYQMSLVTSQKPSVYQRPPTRRRRYRFAKT